MLKQNITNQHQENSTHSKETVVETTVVYIYKYKVETHTHHWDMMIINTLKLHHLAWSSGASSAGGWEMRFQNWENISCLVGSFNPSEKYLSIRSSPQVGVKLNELKKNIWNHHPVVYLHVSRKPIDGHLKMVLARFTWRSNTSIIITC